MNLLYSRRTAEGVDLVYQDVSEGLGRSADLDRVRRVILGARLPVADREGLPAFGYACAIAERCWYGYEDNLPSRQYVLIDEVQASGGRTFFDAVVDLKDKYCAQSLHCPNQPAQVVEALKWHEGLCYYPDMPTRMLRERYRHYVGRDITCAVIDDEAPDEGRIQADIDNMLSTEVSHPDDPQLPLWGATGADPLKRFVVLGGKPDDNFSTQQARQALATGDKPILMAIWLAVMGAERSGVAFGRKYMNAAQVDRAKGRSGY